LINWINIRKRYPKAIQLLVDFHSNPPNDEAEVYGEIDSPMIWGSFVEEPHYVMRHLYDFFDQEKIFIQIQISKMETAPDGFYWCYNIKKIGEDGEIVNGMLNGRENSDLYGSVRRKKCEEHAWIEAFEVLENNIKEKRLRKAKLTKISKK
jgi:hypothetical protein